MFAASRDTDVPWLAQDRRPTVDVAGYASSVSTSQCPASTAVGHPVMDSLMLRNPTTPELR